MARLLWPTTLIVLALACAQPASAADTSIVPGKRVGAVAVGMSRAKIEKLLGAAAASNALSPQRTNAAWPLPGKGELHVQFVDGVAARVGTTAKEYATSDGLAVGASVASMRALHPNATETDYDVRRKMGGAAAAQCYDDVGAGIGFEFDRGAAQREFVLRAIYVHAAGKATPCGRRDDPRAVERVDKSKP